MMSEKRKKITIKTLLNRKKKREKVAWITAYDYPTAVRAERAGIDLLLVGDSMGMTVFGYESTNNMTMEIMLPHAEAVCRGAPNTFVIGDMPFMSYQPSNRDAIINAGRFISAGCSAVKCEGAGGSSERVKAMRDAGILPMGHLGLTPQSTAVFGGYKIQGRNEEGVERLVREAKELEEAGAFSILLEAVPSEAGKMVVEELKIPIYGIGAGPYLDGQLLIVHDILGTYEGKFAPGVDKPRFVKRYGELGRLEENAIRDYIADVREGRFPGEEHCYKSATEKNPCKERS